MSLPEATSLPVGFAVGLDTGVQQRGRVLMGGAPFRILTLSPKAADLLVDGSVVVGDQTSAALARRLLASGVAHPRPTPAAPELITVVVPVKDRPAGLERLLRQVVETVSPTPSLVVVDDGSRDQLAIARIARTYGARLLRHPMPYGPSAARNAGLRVAETRLVAFLDSDCAPVAGWLQPLLDHFADPLVAVVAPRIVSLGEPSSWIGRYEKFASSLDRGPAEASVQPRSRVSYVPSAALLVRRSAVGDGFDEGMRVAEDVDLVWRLVEAGWTVRYEPRSQVEHEHRTRLLEWMRTRAFYGTGAAPLALRHGDAVAPLVMDRWSASAWGLALTGWPGTLAGLGITAVAARRLARRLRVDVPALEDVDRTSRQLVFHGTLASGWQVASLLTRHAWPITLAASLVSRRARRVAVAVALGEGLVSWYRDRPPLDPVRYVAARRLDDLAYGTGLWLGALRHRTLAPLRPAFTKVTRPGR
ncbi:mycofactocin biosynthesis glycosyltransferase MftF [Fodinicola acaciae]|uniref:mycofactocin biosynthesis glycosyltransferase MftF n=1 Tax=Fodinicola acaciae TaxID=2681555 RepID=UPI0013D2B971|nr:mycofactocin biosynthesis glycosyltransferase MftF [Fodinicola acaciae]